MAQWVQVCVIAITYKGDRNHKGGRAGTKENVIQSGLCRGIRLLDLCPEGHGCSKTFPPFVIWILCFLTVHPRQSQAVFSFLKIILRNFLPSKWTLSLSLNPVWVWHLWKNLYNIPAFPKYNVFIHPATLPWGLYYTIGSRLILLLDPVFTLDIHPTKKCYYTKGKYKFP